MKKYMKLLACLLAGAFVLTACDDDDPVVHYREVAVSDGLFIVNEGSYFSQVNGSLDYLDYATGKVQRNVFSAANGTMPSFAVRSCTLPRRKRIEWRWSMPRP